MRRLGLVQFSLEKLFQFAESKYFMTTTTTNAKTVGVSFPVKTLERIKAKAGPRNFSRYVVDACKRRLKNDRKQQAAD